MAGTPNSKPDGTHETPTPLQTLRALAQSHITSLEAEDAASAQQHATDQHTLSHYAKPRRKDRSKLSASSTPSTKGARLRSAQDILDRLRHDPAFDLVDYRIGYLERFEGIREMAADAWIGEFTDEEWIPQHRIKYVKRVGGMEGEEVVWDRERRIDRIFGSGRVEDDVEASEVGGGVGL